MQKIVFATTRKPVPTAKRIGLVRLNKMHGKKLLKFFPLHPVRTANDHIGKIKIGLDRLIVNANQKPK